MGCYIEFLILKEKILEIAVEEISMPVTVNLIRCFHGFGVNKLAILSKLKLILF